MPQHPGRGIMAEAERAQRRPARETRTRSTTRHVATNCHSLWPTFHCTVCLLKVRSIHRTNFPARSCFVNNLRSHRRARIQVYHNLADCDPISFVHAFDRNTRNTPTVGAVFLVASIPETFHRFPPLVLHRPSDPLLYCVPCNLSLLNFSNSFRELSSHCVSAHWSIVLRHCCRRTSEQWSPHFFFLYLGLLTNLWSVFDGVFHVVKREGHEIPLALLTLASFFFLSTLIFNAFVFLPAGRTSPGKHTFWGHQYRIFLSNVCSTHRSPHTFSINFVQKRATSSFSTRILLFWLLSCSALALLHPPSFSS